MKPLLILSLALLSGCAQDFSGLSKDERAVVLADRKLWSDLGRSAVQTGIQVGLSQLNKSDGKTVR